MAEEILVCRERCFRVVLGPRQWRNLAERFPVGPPAALELVRVHVEHQDAAGKVVVDQVHLARGLVERRAFDARHEHLSSRWNRG